MTPTKIKARRMYYDPAFHTVHERRPARIGAKPVHVLDASRYGEMVEQVAASMAKNYAKYHGWEKPAELALRSIGITKEK